MRYIVAVSGGVDSVVLLDALTRKETVAGSDPWSGRAIGELIVAHFDHGIRTESADDASFVAKLAEQYGVAFRSKREELGANTSEDRARRHRYAFLRSLCAEYDADLITAHHADDIAETIAINITRGTGWRGVAVLDTAGTHRPLLDVTKAEIREYAAAHHLLWREDSTNSSEKYLRNRIRAKMSDEDMTWQLASLRTAQVALKHEIDREAENLVGTAPYSRYFFGHCGDMVALELLRMVFMRESGISTVVSARQRALHAIKVAKTGSVVHISDGLQLRFTQRNFVVETTL